MEIFNLKSKLLNVQIMQTQALFMCKHICELSKYFW